MRDRELILGVLATQMRLATPAQGMEAASAALVDPQGRSLPTMLQESGAPAPDQRGPLEAMADAALAASEGKLERVLASLGGPTVVQTFGEGGAPGDLPTSGSDGDGRIPPEREGQYSRLNEIGRGGQSVVLLARDRF